MGSSGFSARQVVRVARCVCWMRTEAQAAPRQPIAIPKTAGTFRSKLQLDRAAQQLSEAIEDNNSAFDDLLSSRAAERKRERLIVALLGALVVGVKLHAVPSLHGSGLAVAATVIGFLLLIKLAMEPPAARVARDLQSLIEMRQEFDVVEGITAKVVNFWSDIRSKIATLNRVVCRFLSRLLSAALTHGVAQRRSRTRLVRSPGQLVMRTPHMTTGPPRAISVLHSVSTVGAWAA
jgi:hypothetical protein